MRILTRYLLRAHTGPFFFSLTLLTALLLINTVAQRFEDLAGKGLPASVIGEVFVLSVPYTIALTLPMAVLVAVLYAFGRITADNEVTALKASGVNLVRLIVPLLVAAAMLAASMVYFHDTVLPASNHRLAALLTDIARKSPTLQLKEQVINPIETSDMRSQYYLQAGRIETATNRLWDVVIYDLSDAGQNRTIYADSGRMAFNSDRTDLFLTLRDGSIHEGSVRERQTFQRLFFDRQIIRIQGVGDRLERGERNQRGDREMSIGQLRDAADQRHARLEELLEETRDGATAALSRALAPYTDATRPPRTVGLPSAGPGSTGPAAAGSDRAGPDRAEPTTAGPGGSRPGAAGADSASPTGSTRQVRIVTDPPTTAAADELRTLADRARSVRHRMHQYEVEYHKKFSIPFACIVFVLIGAPLAVRFPRGGIGMVIAISLGIFAVYYMGLIGGEELADRGIVPAFWAMWAPNVIFLAVGLRGLARIGHETSTTRGGGWEDLWRTVRRAVARPLIAVARRSS